jgi:uncharacterized protein
MVGPSGIGQLLGIAGTFGLLGTGIYSFAIERFWLDIREVRIVLAHLPRSFSGLRIVLLSDIHFGFFYFAKNFSHVIDEINGLRPDVICFTGDLIDSETCLGSLEPAIPFLTRLQAPLGKFAVLGNHDYRSGIKHVIRGLKSGGFQVLQNQHAVLQKANERIYLIGLDDVLEGKPNLLTAMKGIPETACNILLVHEPDYACYTRKFPIDLQLSGHSHGGQVRVPFIWPFFTSRMGKKYVSGLYKTGNLRVYTNRGLGTTTLPLRFLCRPEITVITLER